MAQVNFIVDDQVKRDADELFDRLGVSLSAAITVFLRRSIARKGFPFPVAEDPINVLGKNFYYDYVPVDVKRVDPVAERRAKRRAEIMSLAGTWKDDRSTAEIIKDIESHRTKGREVNL